MPVDHDHSSRLVRVETEMGYLRTGFNKIENALLQIAEDMHKLAISDAEQREHRKTIDRMTARLDAKDAETLRLWDRVEAVEAAAKEAENAELRKEVDKKNRWLLEIGKVLLIVIASVIAAHYSVKLI